MFKVANRQVAKWKMIKRKMDNFIGLLEFEFNALKDYPADTRRKINVIMTSKRRRNVVLTS